MLFRSNDYKLFANTPNPFNPTTTFHYQLPERQFVTLRIYNLQGTPIATLVQEEQTAGNYQLLFNASHVPSGTYLYELRAGDFIERRKFCLLK